MVRIVCIALLLAVVAACHHLPPQQPMAGLEPAREVLDPEHRKLSLRVALAEGVPPTLAHVLARSTVEALEERGLKAIVSSRDVTRLLLRARAQEPERGQTGIAAVLYWTLLDTETGVVLAGHTQPVVADAFQWLDGDKDMAAALAGDAAEAVAEQARTGGVPTPMAEKSVWIGALAGFSPYDEAVARRALRKAFAEAEIPLVNAKSEAGRTLECDAGSGRFDWRVTDRSGRVVGRLAHPADDVSWHEAVRVAAERAVKVLRAATEP